MQQTSVIKAVSADQEIDKLASRRHLNPINLCCEDCVNMRETCHKFEVIGRLTETDVRHLL